MAADRRIGQVCWNERLVQQLLRRVQAVLAADGRREGARIKKPVKKAAWEAFWSWVTSLPKEAPPDKAKPGAKGKKSD